MGPLATAEEDSNEKGGAAAPAAGVMLARGFGVSGLAKIFVQMLWRCGVRRRMNDRLKNFAQRAASAKNAGFHGADGDFENFGDLFVR